MKSSGNTFSKTLSYLKSLEKFGIKPGFEKMSLFLESIGSPHLEYRSVLVAGTNGKGSTASMIASLTEATGLKTGLYTSPHLLTVLERIRINSVNIEKDRFVGISGKLRERLKEYAPDFHLTQFEFLTSLAFLYFYEERVELAVFEVGLGGRLDTTAVVHPELSVITEIDIDHTELLGNSIAEITLEKCGIIREDGQALLTSEKEEVVEIVKNNCGKKGASLYRLGKNFKPIFSETGGSKRRTGFKNASFHIDDIGLTLRGAHQGRNSAAAIQAIHLLTDGAAREDSVLTAFKTLKLEGRAEMLTAGSRNFLLDIAHNPGAAVSLMETIREDFKYNSLILIVGIMKDKDTESILRLLVPMARTTIVTAPGTRRAASPHLLKTRADRFSKSVISSRSVKSAIIKALRLSSPDDLILVTGSCVTVGEAKEYLIFLQVK